MADRMNRSFIPKADIGKPKNMKRLYKAPVSLYVTEEELNEEFSDALAIDKENEAVEDKVDEENLKSDTLKSFKMHNLASGHVLQAYNGKLNVRDSGKIPKSKHLTPKKFDMKLAPKNKRTDFDHLKSHVSDGLGKTKLSTSKISANKQFVKDKRAYLDNLKATIDDVSDKLAKPKIAMPKKLNAECQTAELNKFKTNIRDIPNEMARNKNFMSKKFNQKFTVTHIADLNKSKLNNDKVSIKVSKNKQPSPKTLNELTANAHQNANINSFKAKNDDVTSQKIKTKLMKPKDYNARSTIYRQIAIVNDFKANIDYVPDKISKSELVSVNKSNKKLAVNHLDNKIKTNTDSVTGKIKKNKMLTPKKLDTKFTTTNEPRTTKTNADSVSDKIKKNKLLTPKKLNTKLTTTNEIVNSDNEVVVNINRVQDKVANTELLTPNKSDKMPTITKDHAENSNKIKLVDLIVQVKKLNIKFYSNGNVKSDLETKSPALVKTTTETSEKVIGKESKNGSELHISKINTPADQIKFSHIDNLKTSPSTGENMNGLAEIAGATQAEFDIKQNDIEEVKESDVITDAKSPVNKIKMSDRYNLRSSPSYESNVNEPSKIEVRTPTENVGKQNDMDDKYESDLITEAKIPLNKFEMSSSYNLISPPSTGSNMNELAETACASTENDRKENDTEEIKESDIITEAKTPVNKFKISSSYNLRSSPSTGSNMNEFVKIADITLTGNNRKQNDMEDKYKSNAIMEAKTLVNKLKMFHGHSLISSTFIESESSNESANITNRSPTENDGIQNNMEENYKSDVRMETKTAVNNLKMPDCYNLKYSPFVESSNESAKIANRTPAEEDKEQYGIEKNCESKIVMKSRTPANTFKMMHRYNLRSSPFATSKNESPMILDSTPTEEDEEQYGMENENESDVIVESKTPKNKFKMPYPYNMRSSPFIESSNESENIPKRMPNEEDEEQIGIEKREKSDIIEATKPVSKLKLQHSYKLRSSPYIASQNESSMIAERRTIEENKEQNNKDNKYENDVMEAMTPVNKIKLLHSYNLRLSPSTEANNEEIKSTKDKEQNSISPKLEMSAIEAMTPLEQFQQRHGYCLRSSPLIDSDSARFSHETLTQDSNKQNAEVKKTEFDATGLKTPVDKLKSLHAYNLGSSPFTEFNTESTKVDESGSLSKVEPVVKTPADKIKMIHSYHLRSSPEIPALETSSKERNSQCESNVKFESVESKTPVGKMKFNYRRSLRSSPVPTDELSKLAIGMAGLSFAPPKSE